MSFRNAQGHCGKYLTLEPSSTRNPVEDMCAIVSKFQSAKIGDNHHYQSYCSLPLFIFEGTSHALVTACLRPGKRPAGAENAMIFVRLLAYLRRHGPQTHILVRGDSHFATPEVLDVLTHRRRIDFVFGLAGNAVLLRHAAPIMQEARSLYQQRTALAQAHGERPPARSRLYEEFCYAAASWSQPWRVIVKAEVMAAGDNPRFVVTSFTAPTPQQVYDDLYGARGNGENVTAQPGAAT